MSSKSAGGSGGGTDDVYAAKPIINLLSVEGEEQVMLRVSVAEVQRDTLKQFGINLGALVNSGNFTTAILGDNAFPLSAAAGLGILPVPGVTAGGLNVFDAGAAGIGFPSGAAAIPFVNSGVATAWQSGNQAITGVLRALERDGLVKTLAEPNLTAVSGEPARFLAGGEFPVPVIDSLGQVSVEIIVKGDTVMSGYWNDPEATAKSLRDGWLWTGDVGAFDEEGLLTLKDRSKDMIISGGSNIYPREIEDVLNLHPAVAECSVVGRPHPEWGEEVVAFVVPRDGKALGPAELDQLASTTSPASSGRRTTSSSRRCPRTTTARFKTELRKLL